MTGDLPPGVKAFGDRLEEALAREVAARPRERRGRRRVGRLSLPVAAAVVAAAASAGAVHIVDRVGEPIELEPSASGGSRLIDRDPAVVAASATADPGGGPPWVVRAYTTADGRACVQLGRLREGVFGQVQAGGFRALPRSSRAVCADRGSSGAVVAIDRRASAGLTIVFGLGADHSPVTIRYGDLRRRVEPVVLGAFVSILSTADARKRIVVRTRVAGRDHVQIL